MSGKKYDLFGMWATALFLSFFLLLLIGLLFILVRKVILI